MSDKDIAQLFQAVEKVASTVNKSAKYTEQIPDIKKKVDDTGAKVIELNTTMTAHGERLTKVEDKVGEPHICVQTETIGEIKENQKELRDRQDHDINKGIEQKGQIDGLVKAQAGTEADVEDIKKAPRRMFYGLIGLVLTVATLGGGAVWFLAQLERDVAFERTQRTEQFKRLETAVKAVGTKANPAPIAEKVNRLAEAVEAANGHEDYNELCIGMMKSEKRQVRRMLKNRPIPPSCRIE